MAIQSANLRLRGKTPLFNHIPRSYAMLLRDGVRDRIKLMPWFATFTVETNIAKQIQPQQLPFCGVYLIQENMVADGDANAGEPRFRCNARIGFGIIVLNNDPDAAEYQLDTAAQAILRGLLSDPTLYNNVQFKIQGYTSGQRTHVFGNAGKDNETPIAELRLELNFDLGTITYPPLVTDDLEIIHVQSDSPVTGVVAKYDLEQ